jgi:hypothetical protein
MLTLETISCCGRRCLFACGYIYGWAGFIPAYIGTPFVVRALSKTPCNLASRALKPMVAPNCAQALCWAG